MMHDAIIEQKLVDSQTLQPFLVSISYVDGFLQASLTPRTPIAAKPLGKAPAANWADAACSWLWGDQGRLLSLLAAPPPAPRRSPPPAPGLARRRLGRASSQPCLRPPPVAAKPPAANWADAACSWLWGDQGRFALATHRPHPHPPHPPLGR